MMFCAGCKLGFEADLWSCDDGCGGDYCDTCADVHQCSPDDVRNLEGFTEELNAALARYRGVSAKLEAADERKRKLAIELIAARNAVAELADRATDVGKRARSAVGL